MRKFIVLIPVAFGLLPLLPARAQSPVPIIVQAANATPVPAASTPTPPAAAADTQGMTQLLQEMQATNEATIKKQEATLANLDTLQRAAEDIKIYSKRG